jgi:hypothetical protein
MKVAEVNFIQKIIGNTTVNVENYFLLNPEEISPTAYCFFSYFFLLEPNDEFFQIKMVYFEKPHGTDQWVMKDVLLRKGKENDAPDNENYGWTIYPKDKTILNLRLEGELTNHLEQLYNYLIGESKEEYFKILKRDYFSNVPLLWKTSIDSVGDIGMFGLSALFANFDSNLENKIKDVASRKNFDIGRNVASIQNTISNPKNTIVITNEILESIVLPSAKNTLSIQNIELNNAFRISFK